MEDILETNKSMLKSMILDEEKLITYVSLSKDLCVHVNSSKLLLKRIVDIIREETPDLQLNVTYLISGSTANNNARTIVCLEDDLSKRKELFKSIFFEHIYSVNMGRSSIDTAAYITVNKFDDFILCPGLIKSSLCGKRTSVEISNLKCSSHEILLPEKSKSVPAPSKKIKHETDTIKNNDPCDVKPVLKDKESKSEPIIKTEVLSPKKVTGNTRTKLSSTNGYKTQKGIAGFFNKPNNSTKKEIKTNNTENGKETKTEIEKNVVNVEKMEIDLPPNITKIKDKVKKENSGNNLLNQIKKSSKVDKKRKRVLHVSDSDSDHENNDPFVDDSVPEVVSRESDDEIPPTPTTNSIKITSGILNPKKRRKIVDKTYTDDEGYIHTKKIEVYESCSEPEEDIKDVHEKPQAKEVKIETSPKAKTSGSKKKVSPSQKGKQPTLTTFFKKV